MKTHRQTLQGFLALAMILLIVFFLGIAHAQTPPAPSATLSWSAVTQYTDGTAITAPVTYNVYQGTSATTMVKVATGVTALTQSITTGLSDGNTYFWSVTAVVAGVESSQAPPGSKTFAPGVPSPVINLTVK